MRDWEKSTNASLSSSEGERGGRAGGSNLKKCDKAAGVPWSQAAIRGGLASKEQAAMLSYCPVVTVESMASTRGDGFLSAAAELWAIKLPELGGMRLMLTAATPGAFSLHPTLASLYSSFKP